MSRSYASRGPGEDRPPVDRERGPEGTSNEEPRAVALTVAWMLTAIASLASELVAVAAMVLNRMLIDPHDAQKLPPLARVLPGWFLFCALATGLLCLALTPAVWKVRREKPPRSVMLFAIGAGFLPIATLFVIRA